MIILTVLLQPAETPTPRLHLTCISPSLNALIT